MQTCRTGKASSATILAGALALGLVFGVAPTPSLADDLVIPDWAAIFDANCGQLAAAAGYDDAVCMPENLSNGVAIDQSILTSENVVDNGTVAGDSDLGRAYALAKRDSAGNRVYYIGVERLNATSSGSVEVRLHQGKVQVREGVPWPIYGAAADGDVSIVLGYNTGALSSVDVSVWSGGGYQAVEGTAVLNCGGAPGKVTACASVPPITGTQSDLHDAAGNPVTLAAGAFVGVGVNPAALTAGNAEYSSIQIRTSGDIVLGTFGRIGAWSTDVASSGTGG